MQFRHLTVRNWRNFTKVGVPLADCTFLVGPNASGKSNLLDVFLFLRDLAKPDGGLGADPPVFELPEEPEGEFGIYRSPLIIADGSRVETAAERQRRRGELPAEWHGLMGGWPELPENPALEVLGESVRDDGLCQRRQAEVAANVVAGGGGVNAIAETAAGRDRGSALGRFPLNQRRTNHQAR